MRTLQRLLWQGCTKAIAEKNQQAATWLHSLWRDCVSLSSGILGLSHNHHNTRIHMVKTSLVFHKPGLTGQAGRRPKWVLPVRQLSQRALCLISDQSVQLASLSLSAVCLSVCLSAVSQSAEQSPVQSIEESNEPIMN